MVGESESTVESNRQRDFLTEPDGSFFCEKKMSNKELQPHEQRVVEEKDQLKERLDKLLDFLQKG